MDVVQLSQGSRATTQRLFTTLSPGIPGIHMIDLGKDDRLSRPWSNPVVLKPGPIDFESSTLIIQLVYLMLLIFCHQQNWILFG